MSETEQVSCDEHGDTRCTYVCRHIIEGAGCGFHVSTEDAADKWPDAWCDQCDTKPELEAKDIGILCTRCYEEARARNRGVADIEDAVHRMHEIQDAADARWHFIEMAKWFFDDEAGTLTFTDPKLPTVVADVRLVGSYSTRSGTFQWAWATGDATAMLPVRAFGQVHDIPELTTPNRACEEADGWEMTSIAALVLGAEAIYRMPYQHLYWFMLLSNLRHPN